LLLPPPPPPPLLLFLLLHPFRRDIARLVLRQWKMVGSSVDA